jgi:outer membrane lipoprotein-sorting protein
MKKIGLLIVLIIICNVGAAWADPTVKEILQKVSDNQKAIATMKATIYATWKVPAENLEKTDKIYYYYKAPDKERKELISSVAPYSILQVDIVNGDTMGLIDWKGRTFVRSMQEYSTSENIPGHMDYIDNIDDFLLNYDVSIDSATTDSLNGIYGLMAKTKPKSATIEGSGNEYFKKVLTQVDYNKGIIITEKVYDENDKLLIDAANSDIIQIDNKYWIAREILTKSTDSDGYEIQHIEKYEDIVLDQVISDTLFELPIVE